MHLVEFMADLAPDRCSPNLITGARLVSSRHPWGVGFVISKEAVHDVIFNGRHSSALDLYSETRFIHCRNGIFWDAYSPLVYSAVDR